MALDSGRTAARGLLSLALSAFAPFAAAQGAAATPEAVKVPPAAAPVVGCNALIDDRERLACYDRATGRAEPPVELVKAARDERRARGDSLSERWELDPTTKQGRFLIKAYKPTYVLPVQWTDDINQRPTSDNLENSVPDDLPIRALEAKFQLSLKSKLLETIADTNIDLWAAYTQVSYWQVYSGDVSRPFRETNYEPEVFAIAGVDWPILGWRVRLLGLGIVHQSNGRAEPLSRSWNRVIGQVGLERGDWSILLRPWWRISEDPLTDDNPGIENYIGRGEAVVVHRSGGQLVSLQLRHSLRGGDQSRGSVRLDWAFPVSSYLKAHLQVFSGYGESLIDFNHRQTTIGVGVSLTNWL
jgi:phospholipase A1